MGGWLSGVTEGCMGGGLSGVTVRDRWVEGRVVSL